MHVVVHPIKNVVVKINQADPPPSHHHYNLTKTTINQNKSHDVLLPRFRYVYVYIYIYIYIASNLRSTRKVPFLQSPPGLSMNPYRQQRALGCISVFIASAIWLPEMASLSISAVCEEETNTRQGGEGGRERGKLASQKGYSPRLIRHRAGWVTKVFTFPRLKRTGVSSRPVACPLRSLGNPWLSWSNCGLACKGHRCGYMCIYIYIYMYGWLSVRSFP